MTFDFSTASAAISERSTEKQGANQHNNNFRFHLKLQRGDLFLQVEEETLSPM